jgi:hypothetical protein
MKRVFLPSRHNSLSTWLWQARPPVPVYLAALLLALALVWHLYPLSFLAGQGQYFETGDAASHVSGWLFFKDDEWRFPVLLSQRINAPDGISIAFADSIPLLALVFKPLSGLLPEHFHYFGLWHAFSFLLQAGGAVFLIRSLNVLHWPGALIAAAFAITWPVLAHRFGHTALMSHGLLLLALAFYLRGAKCAWSVRQTCVGFIALTSVALLIHPYLLAMIYPVLLAYLLGQYCTSRVSLLQGFRWVASSILVLLGLMYAGGYLIGKGAAIAGFGIHSLNLLSPFCGGLFCSFLYAYPGQDEGFNYFGAGVLLLLAWTLLSAPMRVMAILKRHWPLLLLLIGFTLFALSNRIFMGSTALLEIPLNDRVMAALGVFRASGRFFWLVGYAVLFTVLSILLRRQTAMTLVFCCCALVLQWYDIGMFRDRLRAGVQAEGVDDLSGWRTTLAGMDQVLIYPAYGCANVHPYAYVGYQRIAAYLGLTVNTAYIARYTQNCEAANAFAQQPGEPGKLYVLAGFTFNPLDVPPLFQQLLRQKACAQRTDQLVCALGYRDKDWRAVAVPLPKDLYLSKQWSAAQLPTVIGHVVNDRLVAKSETDVGYLSYGPYITLPAGEYELQLNYLSQSPNDVQVGHWDMVAEGASGQPITLANGPVYGSGSIDGLIKYPVRLDAAMHKVELRLFKQGGSLALKSVGIRNVLVP